MVCVVSLELHAICAMASCCIDKSSGPAVMGDVNSRVVRDVCMQWTRGPFMLLYAVDAWSIYAFAVDAWSI